SSKTRSLNASHDSSRLMNSFGSCSSIDVYAPASPDRPPASPGVQIGVCNKPVTSLDAWRPRRRRISRRAGNPDAATLRRSRLSATLAIRAQQQDPIIAAIDVGTNAARLEIARVHPDASLETLHQERAQIRPGEGTFTLGAMPKPVVDRLLSTLR